jgi:hypothetical protein
MSQDATVPISPEDWQFLEDHGLGLPLMIYRVKKREIRYFRNIAWSIIILSLLSLSIFIILDIRNWQQMLVLIAEHPQDTLEIEQRYNEPFLFFRSLFSMGGLFLLGLFLLLIRVPSLKKRRVIVCEYGLLQVRGVIRERQETIRWKEIQSVRAFPERRYTHLIRHQKDKPFVISNNYEKLEELLEQIRQYRYLP